MAFVRLTNLEKLIFQLKNQLPINLPSQLLFETNIVLKTSKHASLCLTIANINKKPLCILKFPSNSTPIANKALEDEYHNLINFQKLKNLKYATPNPLAKFHIQNRTMVFYNYINHQKLQDFIYKTTTSINLKLATIPLNWLYKLNLKTLTLQNSITFDLIQKYQKSIFSILKKDYPNFYSHIKSYWKKFESTLNSLPKRNIPSCLFHGDFNPWNLGLKNNNTLIVFDWEDSKPIYPILFDFFYFVIVFYWCLFDERYSRLDPLSAPEIISKFSFLIENYLSKYKKSFKINDSDIQALLIFFLFHNIYIEIEEKRKSIPELIIRWTNVLDYLKEKNSLIEYFKLSSHSFIKNFQESKKSHEKSSKI